MARKKKKPDNSLPAGVKLICKNRRAHRNYELGERFEAGLVLRGTEVKSCRAGNAHINDAYVQVLQGEGFLIGSHIAEYDRGGAYFNHAPDRRRKLLLHKSELKKLAIRINERGFVAVPVALYFKNGRVKVELALGRGRTHVDKRQYVKERDVNRELQRIVRSQGRRR